MHTALALVAGAMAICLIAFAVWVTLVMVKTVRLRCSRAFKTEKLLRQLTFLLFVGNSLGFLAFLGWVASHSIVYDRQGSPYFNGVAPDLIHGIFVGFSALFIASGLCWAGAMVIGNFRQTTSSEPRLDTTSAMVI